MAKEPSGILVPAYVYPSSGSWQPLFSAANYTPRDKLVVIANPDNGPGYDPVHSVYAAPDTNYVQAIASLKKVCASVIGYVHDCYGDTNPRNASGCPRRTPIEDDIKRWFDAYDVDGIFIDQTSPTDPGRGTWLTSVVQGYKTDALIVFNPGTIPALDFMTATAPATVVVQEQTFAHYRNWPPSGWIKNRETGELSIPAHRLAIIAHTPQNGAADIDLMVTIAQRYSIGYVYANDAPGPNYNALSNFLQTLAERIDRLQSRFGLPHRIFARPLCRASQLFKLVRSARTPAGPNH